MAQEPSPDIGTPFSTDTLLPASQRTPLLFCREGRPSRKQLKEAAERGSWPLLEVRSHTNSIICSETIFCRGWSLRDLMSHLCHHSWWTGTGFDSFTGGGGVGPPSSFILLKLPRDRVPLINSLLNIHLIYP